MNTQENGHRPNVGNSLPAEILGADNQPNVDAVVSRATGNSRRWDRSILRLAYKAARPVVEQDMRSRGSVFTRDEVKTAVRTAVAAYAGRYGVLLPSKVVVGNTALEAAAGDICGAFSMPWSAFLPPQVQLAAQAAKLGNPRAKGFLSKFFGSKSKAAPAPASAPVVASTTATPTTAAPGSEDTAGSGDSLGWNPFGTNPFGANSYGANLNQERRRHRHHHHHRHGQQPGSLQPGQPGYVAPYGVQPGQPGYVAPYGVQPGQPGYVAPYGVQPGQPGYVAPYDPATAAQVAAFNASHPSAQVPVVNPYATATNPYATNPYAQPYDDNYIAGSGDSLGAWMQKLNPFYWLKSNEERKLVDVERQAWIDNAALQKKVGKQQVVLDQGEKAIEARKAVEAARARSAEIEAQLKAIDAQISGACGSRACSSSGREEILGDVGSSKTSKPSKPNPYSEDESQTPAGLPVADAAPVQKKIARALELNAENQGDLDEVCAKMMNNQPLSPEESGRLLILLARNEQMHEFRKSLVSGAAYSQNPSAKIIQRNVVLGAVKAMTPSEQKQLVTIVAMAKAGNPNAQKALTALRDQGYAVTMGHAGPHAHVSGAGSQTPGSQTPMTPDEQQQLATIVAMAKKGNSNAIKALAKLTAQGITVTGGSFVGWGISDAFSFALKPITVPAKYAWKGVKKVGRALGITHGDATPQAVRMQRLKAAQARTRAAQARARAADAQSEAEYRAAQAFATAADAEAEAADAEATAKEAAMQTAEAEFMPGQTDAEASAADTSGYTRPVITPLPPTPAETDADAKSAAAKTALKKTRRAIVAKKNPHAAKILSASEENTPAGMKLRASMQLYVKAEKRGSKERRAVEAMVKKADHGKGDKQAIADVRALQLAAVAVKADRVAAKRVQLLATRQARAAKVKAVQKKIEIAMSDKLIRQSRRHQMAKVATVERRAAAGDPKAKKVIATHVARAKAGDPKSVKVVKMFVLTKAVRITASTPREKKNYALAQRKVRQVAAGNKKALRDTRVIAAAAKQGNPNAKRAKKRLEVAAAHELTIKTGEVVLPAAAAGAVVGVLATKEHKQKQAAKAQQQVSAVEQKLATGTASREEVVAAARTEAALGNKEKASELLSQASKTPSAGEELKRVAVVMAASEAGNPRTQANIAQAQQLAAQGDPQGIEAMGKVMAVKNLDQVSKGKSIDPEMKVAVKDIEAAADGNTAAQEKIAVMQERAAAKEPEAIKYMVAATGAAVVARALTSNPKAKDEWRGKAGVAPASTEKEDVAVDAEVVTPGMTSLPDAPLPPVRGFLGLLRASAQALLLATRSPFQNYREGIASRARRSLPSVASAGEKLYTKLDDDGAPKNVTPKKTIDPNYERPTLIDLDGHTIPKTKKKSDLETKLMVHAKKEKSPDEEYMVHGDVISDDVQAIQDAAAKGDKKAQKELDKIRAWTKVVQAAREDQRVDKQRSIEKDRQLPVEKKVTTSLLGDVAPTPIDEATKQKLVGDAKNRFGAIKSKADAGDKQAKQKWQNVTEKYLKNISLASKGDARAKDVVEILKGTGLFG